MTVRRVGVDVRRWLANLLLKPKSFTPVQVVARCILRLLMCLRAVDPSNSDWWRWDSPKHLGKSDIRVSAIATNALTASHVVHLPCTLDQTLCLVYNTPKG